MIIISIVIATTNYTTTTTVPHTIHPNCQAKCGNVTIPYPFGTNDGCYLKNDNNTFLINCNTTSLPHKQRVSRVLSVCTGLIRDHTKVVKNCSTSSDDEEPFEIKEAFTNSLSFPFSPTRNKLFGVGCGAFMRFAGVDVNAETYFVAGCFPKRDAEMANATAVAGNKSCSGVDGCCTVILQRPVLIRLSDLG